MRNILSGARGMAPLVLVILIAWALLSVIFLTGTLLAARSIDRSVNTARTGINPTVERIGKNGKFIDQARIIANTSGKILTAAKPLSGQLTVIEQTASKGIDPGLKAINGKVGSINEVAGSINTNALQIGSTVGSILGNATSIGGSVGSIGGSVGSILTRVRSINNSANLILSDAGAILSNVNSIDGKVARANGQAGTIDRTAAPIAKDLNDVLKLVGRAGSEKQAGTILASANNIDCNQLINGSGPFAVLPAVLGVLSTLLNGPAVVTPGTSKACVQ